MSVDIKKGYGSTLLMVLFGVLAVYGGTVWLPLLVPAAALVWHLASRPHLSRNRN
ncbi:MAG TPA: hypothetical protein VGG14_11270 [Candidatus Sulfotelmatobacter sp.]|jgi:hypothetical protein